MALDPNISLGVRGAQINDPLDTVGKAVALSNALANGKAQQQQQQYTAEALKRVQMQNTQAQKAQAAEDDFAGIRRETNGNIDQALDLYEKRGGNPTYIAKMKEDQAKAVKALSDAHTAQWNEIDKKTDIIANDFGGIVQDKDPTKMVQRAADKTQEYVQSGLLTPEQGKQHLAELQAQGPAAVQGWYDEASTFKHLKDKAAADRAAADEARKVETHNLDVANKTADLSDKYMKEAGVFPESDAQSQTADYKNYLKDKGEGFKGTFDAWQNRDANRRRTVVQNFAPGLAPGQQNTKLSGDDFLKTLPSGTAAQIKAIAEGKSGIPSASSRSQAAQSIRDAVFQYDPTFSEQRAQVRKAFTTGPDAKNLGSLNTAIVHLGRLGDAADALNNGTFTPANEVFNYIKDKFGSEATTNFALLRDAVAGEVAGALKGNATDIEIEKIGKSIRAANSPAQMKGVVDEGMSVLRDKANTYDERFHRENADDPWSPILPSAKAALDKHGSVAKAKGDGLKPTHRFNPATGKADPI